MCKKFTPDEPNKMDIDTKNDVIYQMQERLDKMEQDYEKLMEQVRLANQQHFGRRSKTLENITGQLSFFNEAEACYGETVSEPQIEDVLFKAEKNLVRKSRKVSAKKI